MIYDATERAIAVATTNFPTDLEALLIAKTVATGLKAKKLAKTKILERESADTFAERLGKDGIVELAGLGIYGGQATTQAKTANDGWRESDNLVVFDYAAVSNGPPSELGALVELAAESILRTIDRIAETNTLGVVGAGETARSVVVRIAGTSYVPKTQDWYIDRATVTVPVIDEETGL